MSKHALERRAQALENEFFHEVDHQLVVKLTKHYEHESDQDALTMASGIVDREVLAELVANEITPKTLAAFSMFPAIHVAWANGFVTNEEREAVLRAADAQGIAEGSPAHLLLESWLTKKPSAELLAAWKKFIHAIFPTVSKSAFEDLRDAAMNRAHDIAEAAGGFLNILSISAEEKATLKELEATFLDAGGAEQSSGVDGA